MLNALKQKRKIKRLLSLIKSNELEQWPRVSRELSAADLSAPIEGNSSALELCIEVGHHKLLHECLHKFPQLFNAPLPSNRTLVELVFASEDPLPLLNALLSAGLDPNQEINSVPLVELALEQPPELAMLLINRLAQHKASLDRPALMQRALARADRPLVKFLADSGASLELEDETLYDAELLAFAKRSVEDKKIRDLWG